ncbi:MAG: hypothetical protein R2727_01360, partial [Bacteroidales bacterium]
EEDIVNLLPFGDENEVMLKAVVDYITGEPAKSTFAPYRRIDYEVIADSREITNPFSSEMYIQKPLILK